MVLSKATTEQAFLKVGIYGPPGSGKTYTSLLCATKLGKTAVVDTERSSDFYAADFDFDVVYTRKFEEVYSALKEAVAKKYDCFIIDQITHLWEGVQDEVLANEQRKGSKIWKTYEKSGNTAWTMWKYIKKPWRRLMQELLNAPLHVFMLGRMTTDYEQMPDGEPRKVGQRINAEKDTGHEPHILIRMEYVTDKKKHYAIVEKDRSRTLQGEIFTNPDISMFAPVLVKLGKIQAHVPEAPEGPITPDEEFALESGEVVGKLDPGQVKLLRLLAKKGGITDEAIDAMAAKLTRTQAGELINQMTVNNFSHFQQTVKE